MSDQYFDLFKKKFGEATYREEVPSTSLDMYRNVLPNRLLNIWKDEGWSAYKNGLFWIVDPQKYQHLLNFWLQDTELKSVDRFHVIARGAFGDMYAWGQTNNRSFSISCSWNRINVFGDEIRTPAKSVDVAIGCYLMTKSLEACDFYDEDAQLLFDRAVNKLGVLERDEMYGFEPALVLGGQARLENLCKVNLSVHLSILREFAAPSCPTITLPKDLLKNL